MEDIEPWLNGQDETTPLDLFIMNQVVPGRLVPISSVPCMHESTPANEWLQKTQTIIAPSFCVNTAMPWEIATVVCTNTGSVFARRSCARRVYLGLGRSGS